jgi:glycosyltransferase involved in cell wall biosynthesis
MRIVYDHSIFSIQSVGGISRYFVNLVNALLLLGESPKVIAMMHKNAYLRTVPDSCILSWGYSTGSSKLDLLINDFYSNMFLERRGADVIHETYYRQRPRILKSSPPRVTTVYDMIHEKFPDLYPRSDKTTALKKEATSRADMIFCISDSTKRDLLEIFGVPEEKIRVTHLGVEKLSYSGEVDTAFLSLITSGKPYALFVGSRWGYKNFKIIIDVFSRSKVLRDSLRLISFGGGNFSPRERYHLWRSGFREGDIIHLGGGDATLAHLYSNAHLLIVPSLYEGFGLPALEAMIHGCPVVSSSVSSLPEVVGRAGLYFDPLDADELERRIFTVLEDDAVRSQLVRLGFARAKEFTWSRCALSTLAHYKTLS